MFNQHSAGEVVEVYISDSSKTNLGYTVVEREQKSELCSSPPKKKFKKVAVNGYNDISIDDVIKSSSSSPTDKQFNLQSDNSNNDLEEGKTLKNEKIKIKNGEENSPKVVEKERKDKKVRLKLKEEDLKKKEEEKKKKEEEKRKKEEERKKKEEERRKKEDERKKKEEERRKKEEERKKKEEERRKKEEEKKIKDDEKKKKEEAIRLEKEKKDLERKKKEELKKEEDEAARLKKEKAATHFKSFFTKKEFPKKADEPKFDKWFALPFQLKPNQSIAPLRRKEEIDVLLLDSCIEKEADGLQTYIDENLFKFKNIKHISRRSQRTKVNNLLNNSSVLSPRSQSSLNNSSVLSPKSQDISFNSSVSPECQKNDDAVILIDDESSFEDDEVSSKKSNLVKLLQFSENTRPAYYGTWGKKSKLITGRNPFKKDEEVFDYNIDSDEEWEDEPGEDLDDHIDDEDKEEDETEDDKDGFFVPHGYLSDNEGIEEDSFDDDLLPGVQNKIHDENAPLFSFEREFQKKSRPLKPICIGVMFYKSLEAVHPLLKDYMSVALFQTDNDKTEENCNKLEPLKVSESCSPQIVPEEAMPFLLQYIHGSSTRLREMVVEFIQFWRKYSKMKKLSFRYDISKRQLTNKIKSISTRSYNNYLGKMCYTVNDIVLQNYKLGELKLGLGLPSFDENIACEEICK